MTLPSWYRMWRFRRTNEAITRITAVLLNHPDDRHFLYPLRRAAGIRSIHVTHALDRLLAAGHVADGWDEGGERDEPFRMSRRFYVLTERGRQGLARPEAIP